MATATPTFPCTDCGVLLQNIEDIDQHADTTKHDKLLTCIDGSSSFFCCFCSFTSNYDAQMDEHTLKEGHKLFMHAKIHSDTLGQAGYKTPQKSGINVGSTSAKRTLKKAPKLTAHWTSLVPNALKFHDDDDYTVPLPKSLVTSSISIDDDSSDEDVAAPSDLKKDEFGALFVVRSLENVANLDRNEIDGLKNKYVLAQGVDQEAALAKVKDLLTGWEANEGFDLMKKGKGAYRFDNTLKQLCLVRTGSSYPCAPDKARRMFHLLQIIEYILSRGMFLRIRGLYYIYPALHRAITDREPETDIDIISKAIEDISLNENPQFDQVLEMEMREINDAVGEICQMLEITRESLNLFGSPVGLITGPVLLRYEGETLTSGNLGGRSGSSIPGESILIDSIVCTSNGIDFILVVEKDTVFHYLTDHDFHENHNCVLITGKGHPDMSTRILLTKLQQTFPEVPMYCLVDANPSGAIIYCTYRFGSERNAHQNLLMTASHLTYIGLDLKDILDEACTTELTTRDKTTIKHLLDKRYIHQDRKLVQNLMLMKNKGRKANIEMIFTEENLEVYILKKIMEVGNAK